MSEVKVNKLSPRSGTTVTLGDSGDTITIPSGVTFDASSGGLAGTLTTAAQPNITSVGTLTSFTSTGIDDNATSTAIQINSNEQVILYGQQIQANNNTSNITYSGGSDSNAGANLTLFGGSHASTPNVARFRSSATEVMRILADGKIGIGTSSPGYPLQINSSTQTTLLHLVSTAGTSSAITFANTGSNDSITVGAESDDLKLRTDDGNIIFAVSENNEKMRLSSNGVLGIGAVPPSNTSLSSYSQLQVGNSFVSDSEGINSSFQILQNAYVGSGNNNYAVVGSGASHSNRIMMTAGVTSFSRAYPVTADSQISYNESMRIDSSGNVLVGTTNALSASNTTDSGCMLTNSHGWITSNGASALRLQRLTSDGLLQTFYSSGTLAGALSIKGGDLAIHSQAGGHCGLRFTDEPAMLPTDYGGDISNGSMDIGRSSNKFQDIFATNGTIQTSDQNEKQSIQSLTTAEMNVAKRLSPLIKTFKWNSAVEEKGDSARTHTGIIAQDVQQAFTDEGLDASNYALFCSDTWWEKEISVEATEEQEAHTYIDYKQEVTNGYTEKTRLGVRYPELLSFIQAYNDQRFTELEARITQLENA